MTNRNKSILVLEQDLFFGVMIRDTLEKQGYRIQLVQGEGDFRHELEAMHPALVILDYGVEGVDWEDIVREAKGNPNTGDIPFLAFGSHRDLESRSRAQEAGCDAVVAKSALAQGMVQLVQEFLN